jgi:hypothetical protein
MARTEFMAELTHSIGRFRTVQETVQAQTVCWQCGAQYFLCGAITGSSGP